MSDLSFCLQQRQQEEQKSRKLLAIGLIGSIVLHGAIGSATVLFKEEPKTTNKPIELIVVDAPKPVPEIPKPKQAAPKPVQVTPPPPKPQPEKIEPVKTAQPQPGKLEPAKPKIENRRSSSQPGQPRGAGVAPKPEPKLKPNVVTSSQARSRPSILTNPNPSASSTKVPEQPKVESDSPVVPSSAGTGNNISQGTGTGDSQGSGNSNGSEISSGNGGNGDGNGGNGDGSNRSGTSTPVAVRSTPATPKPTPKARQELKCIRNCTTKYPSVLNGVEGTVFVRITIDNNGNVIDAKLAQAHSNSQINEQALIFTRTIKYAPRPGEDNKTIRYRIDFNTAGSDFERLARQRREQQERQAREREQQRQAQLEKERKAQQQQEQERRAQQQQQQQQQPPTEAPPPSEPIVPDVPETDRQQ